MIICLKQLKNENPTFAKGREFPALAFSLYLKNPNATPQIARTFGISEKQVRVWIKDVDENLEEEVEILDDKIERLEEEKETKKTANHKLP